MLAWYTLVTECNDLFLIENFYIILLFVEINALIGRPLEPEHLEDEYSMTIIYVSCFWTQKNCTILQTD